MEEYKFQQKAPQIQELLDKTEAMPSAAEVNAMKQMMDTHVMLPENYAADKEGIYRTDVDDGKVYPVIHPDLSTQPSRMPYRFGNQNIYEVLIPLVGLEEDSSGIIVPFNLFAAENKVLHASVFNIETGVYAPVSIYKYGSQWYAYPLSRVVSLSLPITFDFLRLQYFCNEDGYGYSGTPGDQLRIYNVDGVTEGSYYGNPSQHGGRSSVMFNQDISEKGEPSITAIDADGNDMGAQLYAKDKNIIVLDFRKFTVLQYIFVSFSNGETANIYFSIVQA